MARKKVNYRKPVYTLTDADAIEFNRYYIKNTKRGRKVVWQQRMILPMILLGYVILMLIFKFNSKPVYVFGAFVAAAAVAYGLACEKIVLNRQEAEIKRGGYNWDNIHPEPTTIDFAGDKIEASYKGQNKDFEYGDIMKVTCTDQAIYLWLNDTVAMQIPVRGFESEQDMSKLFDFLGEKCENAELDDARGRG